MLACRHYDGQMDNECMCASEIEIVRGKEKAKEIRIERKRWKESEKESKMCNILKMDKQR